MNYCFQRKQKYLKIFIMKDDAIKFVEDYGSMILEVKREATEGKELKSLTSKQMLQRLPIVFAKSKSR